MNESPAGYLGALITESEEHGLRFVPRLADEWVSGANRVDQPGEVLFVARIGEDAVGVCGLNVDPYAGTQTIGRVRHLYVRVSHRRLGVGQRLVTEVIRAARGRFDHLRLRTENPGAARFYEGLGFPRAVGVRDCTHVMALCVAVRSD